MQMSKCRMTAQSRRQSERSEESYDAGLATCAAGALGALCAAALCFSSLCFSFSRSFSVFLGANIA